MTSLTKFIEELCFFNNTDHILINLGTQIRIEQLIDGAIDRKNFAVNKAIDRKILRTKSNKKEKQVKQRVRKNRVKFWVGIVFVDGIEICKVEANEQYKVIDKIKLNCKCLKNYSGDMLFPLFDDGYVCKNGIEIYCLKVRL